MRILAIETSCDETAIAVLEAKDGLEQPKFEVMSHALYSQAHKHAEFGGVYPNLARREHRQNLLPLLKTALSEADIKVFQAPAISQEKMQICQNTVERYPGFAEEIKEFVEEVGKPDIEYIAVTKGPGLEPALWVGINFAKVLSQFWNVPLVGINHMEGHIYSVLIDGIENDESSIVNQGLDFPALALLISGGHTELILIEDWGKYKLLGQTRDDAVGEAYDKTARVLGLPYPGGPQISRLADNARKEGLELEKRLPRPMIHTQDLDFSFSGLKTAVLYHEKEHGPLSNTDKKKVAREIDQAITDVLIEKTQKALVRTKAKTLIIAGGVIANTYIRDSFTQMINAHFPNTALLIPKIELSTDNAVMIGKAAYVNILKGGLENESLKAQGALRLDPVL